MESDRLREAVTTVDYFDLFHFSVWLHCFDFVIVWVLLFFAVVCSSPFVRVFFRPKNTLVFQGIDAKRTRAVVSRVRELCPSQNSGRKLVPIGLHGSGNLGM